METKLLLALFFCHFLADYTHLSTPTMLAAKKLGTPIRPIYNHATMHGILMLMAMWLLTSGDNHLICFLALFQIGTHFLIDVWKGKMNKWFPSLQNPANKWHWIVFGFDQFLHAVVIITMVHYLILEKSC